MKIYFEEFILDEFGAWANICGQHATKLNDIHSNNLNVTKDSGEGTCSVKGCLNEATCYIHFSFTKK